MQRLTPFFVGLNRDQIALMKRQLDKKLEKERRPQEYLSFFKQWFGQSNRKQVKGLLKSSQRWDLLVANEWKERQKKLQNFYQIFEDEVYRQKRLTIFWQTKWPGGQTPKHTLFLSQLMVDYLKLVNKDQLKSLKRKLNSTLTLIRDLR
jgi:hypothetical protein